MKTAALCSLTLFAAACGNNTTLAPNNNGCTAENATATTTVALRDLQFSPQCIVVSQGASVTFENQDTAAHEVYSTAASDTFDNGNQPVGQNSNHIFNTVGTTSVFCRYHSNMLLTVVVQNGGTGTTTTGGTTSGCNATNATATNEVSLSYPVFDPNCIVISAGTSVTWTNNNSITHDVASVSGTATFDNGPQTAGAQTSFLFQSAGTTEVECTLHPVMKMTVVVQ